MNGHHPLRIWRAANGLTLAKLGEAIGVDKSTVSSYEHSRRTPRPGTIRKIITLTGGAVSANDFLPADTDEAIPAEAAE